MNQDNLYLQSILEQYFPHGSWTAKKGAGGMNNTTRIVEAEGDKYVLRIYETHRDMDKVQYEHTVLSALAEMSIPLNTPKPVYTKDGKTAIFARDGKIAGLFHYIEGANPSLKEQAQLVSFGSAVGRLNDILAAVKTGIKPVYRPYYEIENSHPRCSIEMVLDFCKKPPAGFVQHKAALWEVGEQLENFRQSLPVLKKLPHQLIHGDINASNVLADQQEHILRLFSMAMDGV